MVAPTGGETSGLSVVSVVKTDDEVTYVGVTDPRRDGTAVGDQSAAYMHYMPSTLFMGATVVIVDLFA